MRVGESTLRGVGRCYKTWSGRRCTPKQVGGPLPGFEENELLLLVWDCCGANLANLGGAIPPCPHSFSFFFLL